LLIEHGAAVNARSGRHRAPIHEAVDSGYFDVVQTLLASGSDPNMRFPEGLTLLQRAVIGQKMEIAELLLTRDVELDVHSAAGMNRTDQLEELLFRDSSLSQAKLPNGDTPLHIAARCGASDAAQLLISRNANVNAVNKMNRAPLHLAAEFGHVNIASSLLAAGAKVNCKTEGRGAAPDAPLHQATRQGHLEMIELLVNHGADVNTHAAKRVIPSPLGAIKFGGQTPLHDASRSGCGACVALLLERGGDIQATDSRGLTPLIWAVDAGSLAAVTHLLDAGVDANIGMGPGIPLHLAAYNGDAAMVELLLDHGASVDVARKDGATALFRAVSYPEGSKATTPMTTDRLAAISTLVNRGANVNVRGFLGDTPLHQAASHGYTRAIVFLIDHGADANARNDSGSTPLHAAAMQGRTDAVGTLISKGANVNARSEHNTPLSLAVRVGHNDSVALLLKHGGDINTVDHRGMTLIDEIIDSHQHWSPETQALTLMLLDANIDLRAGNGDKGTPLHEATKRGRTEIAAMLIQRGADVNARDQSQQTPLHIAVEQKQMEIVKLLIANGAEINRRDSSNHTPMYYAWGTGVSARIKELLREHGGVGAFGERDDWLWRSQEAVH